MQYHYANVIKQFNKIDDYYDKKNKIFSIYLPDICVWTNKENLPSSSQSLLCIYLLFFFSNSTSKGLLISDTKNEYVTSNDSIWNVKKNVIE